MESQWFYKMLQKTWVWHVVGQFALLFALGGLPAMVWGGAARMVWVYHVTWCVNSASHVWGNQTYNTGDLSRNNWWVGLLAFGEGWHNNHHAFEVRDSTQLLRAACFKGAARLTMCMSLCTCGFICYRLRGIPAPCMIAGFGEVVQMTAELGDFNCLGSSTRIDNGAHGVLAAAARCDDVFDGSSVCM